TTPAAQWAQVSQWLQAMVRDPRHAALAGYVPEAVALRLIARELRHRSVEATLVAKVDGLLGEHPRIDGGRITLTVDDFLARFRTHRTHFVPGFERSQALRQRIAAREREGPGQRGVRARPPSRFGGHRLIDGGYLA